MCRIGFSTNNDCLVPTWRKRAYVRLPGEEASDSQKANQARILSKLSW